MRVKIVSDVMRSPLHNVLIENDQTKEGEAEVIKRINLNLKWKRILRTGLDAN